MAVDNVVTGTIIESVWGNSVADHINGHIADIIDLYADIAVVASDLDTAEAAIVTNATNISNHLADAIDAHDASAISYSNLGSGLTAAEVQAALDELAGTAATTLDALSDLTTVVDGVDTAITDHLADTVDAHDASAILFTPTGTIAATDVQAAVAELGTEKLALAGGTMTGRLFIPNETLTLAALTGNLVIGASAAPHVAIAEASIQAKTNNTSAAVLNLNPLGGAVQFGAGILGSTARLNATAPVSLSTPAYALALGTTGGVHLQLSDDQIQAVNNTSVSNLYLNPLGGNIYLHAAGTIYSANGSKYLNLSDTGGWIILANTTANQGLYLDGATTYFRSHAGIERANIASDGIHLASGLFYRVSGAGGIYWTTHGGGWIMDNSTYIKSYADKAIYVNNNHITANGSTACLIAGTTSAVSTNNKLYVQMDATGSWSLQQIVIRNANSAAGQCAGLSFHAHNVAPILKAFNGADALEVRNNPDTAFAAITASAFTVSSTLRSKIDVIEENDEKLLARVRPAKQIRFKQKIRPQYIRKTERFKKLDVAWQASGKSPLTPKQDHYYSADHDCEIDECNGTKKNPCSMTLNDTEVIGLAAEDVFEYFPEAVQLDADGLPQGIDVAQVATSAFAAVGALLRKVEVLEAKVSQLA